MVVKRSELRLRVISAIILAALALSEVLVGGWLFAVFVSVMAFIVFLEWTAIVRLEAFGALRIGSIALMSVSLLSLVFFGPQIAFVALCICTAAAFFWTRASTLETAGWTAFAVFYCGMSALALVELRNAENGIAVILLLFAIVWGTDIGAYFVGRKIGGPKLAPKISPGKTQSGAFGGFVIAMICGCLIAVLTQVLDPITALFIAGLISIVSQIGDLFESYLKRRFSVKDSGSIIPGHGGVFDRVDGLMPAAIALFVVFKFL